MKIVKLLRKVSITLCTSICLFVMAGLFIPISAEAGPGDGRGEQYWKCRWVIGCDSSTTSTCSTSSGNCNIK